MLGLEVVFWPISCIKSPWSNCCCCASGILLHTIVTSNEDVQIYLVNTKVVTCNILCIHAYVF